MKPGGTVLLRDYGFNDHTMQKFESGSNRKVEFKSYVRCDNTLSYFFELEEIEKLFCDVGFIKKTNEYVLCETVNVKEELKIPRILFLMIEISQCKYIQLFYHHS